MVFGFDDVCLVVFFYFSHLLGHCNVRERERERETEREILPHSHANVPTPHVCLYNLYNYSVDFCYGLLLALVMYIIAFLAVCALFFCFMLVYTTKPLLDLLCK